MAISNKNEETERLVREMAQATGEGKTEAVTKAVKERLARVRRRGNIDRIEAIVADAAKRFRPPYDTIDHGSLLYSEVTGLPK